MSSKKRANQKGALVRTPIDWRHVLVAVGVVAVVVAFLVFLKLPIG